MFVFNFFSKSSGALGGIFNFLGLKIIFLKILNLKVYL